MEHIANQIILRGSLSSLPEFSHENHGRQFYRFVLEVPRLSGAVDRLPVVTQLEQLNQMDLSGGEMLTVTGQIRSRAEPIGSRLRIADGSGKSDTARNMTDTVRQAGQLTQNLISPIRSRQGV